MPRWKIQRDSLTPIYLPCVNCDQPISLTTRVRLFCSQACGDEARFVRYVRRCTGDGRIQRPDVRAAIKIKFALILSGGYPAKERRLSKSQREAVFVRDEWRCRKCGEPGTTIDHVSGSSNEIENLHLLCRACHNKKTASGFVEIAPEQKEQEKRLRSRTRTKVPQRSCDDEGQWPALYRQLMKSRRLALSPETRLAALLAKLVDVCEENGLKNPTLETAKALIRQRATMVS
jgi:hypothetical protein